MIDRERLERALLLAGIRARLGRCSAYVAEQGGALRILVRSGPARHATAAWLRVAPDGAIFLCQRGGAATRCGHVRDLCSDRK